MAVPGRGLSLPSLIPPPTTGQTASGLSSRTHAELPWTLSFQPLPREAQRRPSLAQPGCCPPKSLRNPGETSGQSQGQPGPGPACLLLPNNPTLRDDVACAPGPPHVCRQQTQVRARPRKPHDAHLYTHVRTHMHVHKHIYMCVLTYACTCTHACTQGCACMCVHACMHPYVHSPMYMHACVYACVCMCVCKAHAHMHAHKRVPTHMGGWVCVHVHAYTQVCMGDT